jgi:hypothetical protein
MKIISLILIILLNISLIIFQSNCSSKITAQGEDNLVYVFCDSSDWSFYQEPFEKIFSQFVRTPIMESEYILLWKSFNQLDAYKKSKNIFLLGRLDAQDVVSRNIKDLLNPEIIEGVQSGKYFYIPKNDVWARDQYVMFFVAVSVPDMVQKILDLGNLAYNDFRNYYFSRLKEQMFSRMEQKSLQNYLESHFPFTMRIQHDYFIANENLEKNFVWIRRLDPDRSILIHWLPYDSSITLNSRWIIDERNRLAKITLSGDVIVEEETKAYATRFKNWSAIKLEGTWRNDSLVVGGPFKNITFRDSLTNRIYMLDYYVQAIGKRKVLFLDQLTVLVHTFAVLDKPKGLKN